MGKKKGGNPGGPSGEQAPQQQRQQQPPQQHQQQQGGQRGPPGGGGGHQGGGGGRGGGNQGGRGGGQQGEDRSRGGGHQGGRGGGQQGGRGGGQQGGRGGGQQGGRGGGQQGGRGGGQQGGRGGGQLGEGRGGGYQGEDGRGRGGAPWGRGGRGGEGHQGGGRGRGQDGTGDQQSVARAPPQQSQFPQQGDPCRQSTPPQAPLQQAPPQPVQTTPSPSASSTSSKGDAASLVSQTTSLSLGISSEQWSKAVMPLRESRNKAPKVGRPITVETNHLKLAMVNSKAVVFHYDVTFVPEKPFRFCRPAMEQIKRKHYPDRHPAFDGKKNLYSFTRLPLQDDILREKVVIFDDERQAEKEIEVKVQMVNSVDMTSISEYLKSGSSLNPPQEAIQALDIVLRQPAMTGFTQVRRSYFTPPSGQAFRLGGGLDLWYGFFQSAILGARPFVNIDVAHKGFPASVNCIQAIEDIINEGQRSYGPQQQQQRIRLNPNSPIENYVIEKFTSLVKGLKVVYRKPVRQSGQAETRTYKVHNVGESARDKRFRKEGGQLISVEEYFQNEYRVRLDFPNAPCLIVGSLEKPLSLPAELCTIAKGQVINRQMDEIQTRNMVQQAARPPPERKSRIMDSLTQLRINENPCVREFGLSVEPRFLQVQGRVLSAPKLQYGDRTVPAARGEWRAEKFIMAKSLDNWVIYHSRVRDNDIQQLWRGFISSGQQLGMRVSQPNVVEKRRIDADFQTFKKNGAQLVVVIIPDFDRTGEFTYAKVKRIAETQVGVLTQCLRNRTMRKLSPPTLVNILLKVNAKLNGVNHNIERGVWPKFLERPVMVVGADVTHPAPTSDPSKPPTVPSVAAVAASHDPNAFKYNMLWRLQPAREEMITELEAIMKEQLMFFYKANNGLKPEAIYFYRDGVSEGQFQKVLQIEVNAVKRACKALSFGDPYEPPITFLVVQKRHHTRFFPTRREDEEGKNRNVPAGTVVDTTIVHPRELDFYLVSHASIQGTARPTKYHLLYEDLPMAEATLEEITYYLCHLFTRCTRSVSYPAPTYYAHLAAFRIRHYLEREMVRMDRLPDLQNSLQIKQFLSVDHPMFFV